MILSMPIKSLYVATLEFKLQQNYLYKYGDCVCSNSGKEDQNVARTTSSGYSPLHHGYESFNGFNTKTSTPFHLQHTGVCIASMGNECQRLSNKTSIYMYLCISVHSHNNLCIWYQQHLLTYLGTHGTLTYMYDLESNRDRSVFIYISLKSMTCYIQSVTYFDLKINSNPFTSACYPCSMNVTEDWNSISTLLVSTT